MDARFIDHNEIIARLRMLMPGTAMVYYTGFLAKDRLWQSEYGRVVHLVGGEAWKLYQQGKITLTQRKVSFENWQYIAQGVM